jgi:List-Bact-rpt repeat protein
LSAGFSPALLALALLAAPLVAHAQSAVMVGTLGNFDVLNNTGQEAHGFEIQLEGIHAADIYRIFGNWGGTNVIRYGAGTATDYSTGVYVRWTSPWDPGTQTFTLSTPVPTSLATVPGESCWTLGMGQAYYSAGCEHFGISAYRNPTITTYHWLVADPQNPGALTYAGAAVSLPAPIWTVVPPAQVGNPPAVVAQIEAAPAPAPAVFGDAQWVKTYKTENPGEVQLEELVGGDPVVPQDAAQLEVSWKLIQQDPPDGSKRKGKGQQVNGGNLGNGSHAVVRRYEHYEYTGAYDPVTHEALCGGDGSCSAPLDGELGDAIGAQNAAANVNVPSLTVTRVNNGTVSGASGKINCGGTCFVNLPMGTAVTLTETPASNTVFTGWSGACTGAQSSCSTTVDDAIGVTATFTPIFTLSIGRGGSGTVTGTPTGVLSTQINCGSNCSAKFMQGTTVTLTATPASGLKFVNWTGSGSGACNLSTVPTCDVTIANQDLSVQANFK